jgi:beta-glucosidase-like glycosyl hydrolase
MKWTINSRLSGASLLALAIFSSLTAAKRLPEVDSAIQVGYHVIFSYPGVQPPSELYDLISQGKVGGIILFGENVADNLSAIVGSFNDAYAQSPGSAETKPPLLIMTDQEGGEVRRLSGGPSLSEKEIGESSNPPIDATTAGQQAAAALDAVQVNTNLALVLGVYREPGDFLDEYQRSYSNDSAILAECAAAFIAAQQSKGFIATAKHFPGLGAAETSQNTDAEPVTIGLSLDTIRSVDEAPYHQAIAAGVDMVMASWAVYPALDAQKPSGLSTRWIQSELRRRLGFRGVTITDAIEAGALEAFGDDNNRALLASQAGMDLILASARNVTQGSEIIDALVSALSSGSISQSSFSVSTQRILDLREKLA